jgi:serine/threonine-protein kinase
MSASPRSQTDIGRLIDVFGEAVERAPAERSALLDAACSGAPDLRAEVESLLSANAQAGDFCHALDPDRGAALLAAVSDVEPSRRRAGPYRLLQELGRGGMGVVYLAERVEGGFEQRAVIKLIKRGMDSDAILRRFLRERQILAGLEHVNVARLLDGGVTDDGQPYFAMEYVDGQPLTAYCNERRLTVEQRLRLFEDGCRAVQHAHGKLVVHRDLKPSNILVTRDGQLKLLDFGIAKLLVEEDDATAITQAGRPLLTPAYAAPEQVRGEPVTTATDVYALGVVLYVLLTGRHPYDAEGRRCSDVARAVCEVEPQPPSVAVASEPRLARRLRGDLDTIVLKALSKEPSRRYASAEAMAEDVRRHLRGHPVQAHRDTMAYVVTKFVRRHFVGVATAAVVTLSLFLGLIGTAWQATVAARERDRARLETERAEKVKEFLVDLFRGSDPVLSKGETITARDLLERGIAKIERELDGHAALQAELFGTVARISHSLGRYDRARALGERSVELTRQAYGPDDPQVAEALDTLGWILQRSGDYAAAEDVARQALAHRRRLLPADSPDLATSIELLGVLLRERGKSVEAEPLHREALAILQRRLGPDHPNTASSLSNLGNVLYMKGDYSSAAEQHREVIRIQRKALGDRHASVATSLVSLGVALVQDGNISGAEAAYGEALTIRREVYGDEHPRVSESLHHLAAASQAKGDLPGAETLYRQALAMDRTLKGEGHRDVGVVLANLAHALAQQAQFEEAMPLFEKAAALLRRTAGRDHPLLARTLERYGSALVDEGRAPKALPLLDECVAINQARYGAQHPAMATALAASARARAAVGEPGEAEKLFREALAVQRQVRSTPHVTTVEILTDLGESLADQGRAIEAEPLLREALSQARTSLPPSHWRRGKVESALGASMLRLGADAEDAQFLLETGYATLRRALGDGHPVTGRARARLDGTREGRLVQMAHTHPARDR